MKNLKRRLKNLKRLLEKFKIALKAIKKENKECQKTLNSFFKDKVVQAPEKNEAIFEQCEKALERDESMIEKCEEAHKECKEDKLEEKSMIAKMLSVICAICLFLRETAAAFHLW